jgi:hypothetical protein
MASSDLDDTDRGMVSLILDYLHPQPNFSNLGHGFEAPTNFDLQLVSEDYFGRRSSLTSHM